MPNGYNSSKRYNSKKKSKKVAEATNPVPSGPGFGQSFKSRFSYVDQLRTTRRNFSCLRDTDTLNNTKKREASYSFGTSRSVMQKIHVDEILAKAEERLPGPAQYERHDSFGKR